MRHRPEQSLRELKRSERQRLLAAAAVRVERTRQYRDSLGALQQLVSSFRAELNEAQNARWLAVEEALLEHAARVNEAYFWEGACTRAAVGARHERAVIAALADIVARWARR